MQTEHVRQEVMKRPGHVGTSVSVSLLFVGVNNVVYSVGHRHPDKNKDPQANEKFMKINEAYEVRRIRIVIGRLSDDWH